ncbi:putative acetyltransferase OgpAT [Grifola frondosa]|uniref:Putative acetyltransferase OgpAT n=1 Tax=Grifola frondosa TaxID=5627 RepID=A0A1C7MP55_GRIFR|nr:putative acetyltransferase OgpAT [Grifola frondosa]
MSETQRATQVYIREVSASDSPALSRICLLTADTGQSAELLHDFGELPGLVYAEPYAHLPAAFGFVMVDPVKGDEVVGYVLGAYDTRAFEQQASEAWYPRVRAKYPYPPADPTRPLKDADKRYIEILHNPHRAAPVAVAFSPAHLHIDILAEYQRQGWGRRLIGRAVEYLKEERGLSRLWLGLDPKNVGAKKFYERLGFEEIKEAPPGTMGLRFENLV